ncbi:MAG: glycosyltransferase [Desulfuromonadales bacterium]|nr:glycosyltransferase [Desulfuromonadales bacterium]
MPSASRQSKERLKVAHLIDSPAIGGSEICALEICRHLDPLSYQPLLLFLRGREGAMIPLAEANGVPWACIGWSRYWRLFGPLVLAMQLKKLRIDILHIHHVVLLRTAFKAAKLAGIKRIILTEHAKHTISRSEAIQQDCRKLIPQLDGFSVISQNLKDYFCREIGLSSQRLTVISNGIDTSKYAPIKQRRRLDALLPEGFQGILFMTVGRLADAKDHPSLLQAMQLLQKKGLDFHLLIVGDGALREKIEADLKLLGLQDCVSLTGGRSDIPELLSGCDIFVLSSKREGLPMVILEAMSCALPVASTAVGAIPEVIRDGVDGVLTPAQNPQALADALFRLATDESLRTSLQKQARSRICNHFEIGKVVEQYAALYSEVAVKR